MTPRKNSRGWLLPWLGLFTSLGTLLCCALPSLLVLVGLGATVASALSAAPFLVALSHHRAVVFTVAGALIGGNFGYLYLLAPRLKQSAGACDPSDTAACDTASRLGRAVLWISAAIYLIGFSVAYLLGPILGRLAS